MRYKAIYILSLVNEGGVLHFFTSNMEDIESILESMSSSDRDKMMNFLQDQTKSSLINSQALNSTELCFSKCKISTRTGTLTTYEENCAKNCVERFMESTLFVMQTLNQK
jgi:import inner membrane translocase subunit TIM8